jgi:hypothetical protein
MNLNTVKEEGSLHGFTILDMEETVNITKDIVKINRQRMKDNKAEIENIESPITKMGLVEVIQPIVNESALSHNFDTFGVEQEVDSKSDGSELSEGKISVMLNV